MIDSFTGFTEVAKEIGSDADKGINDFDKRKVIDDVNHNSERIDSANNAMEKVNVDRRISNEKTSELNDIADLSDKQKSELIDKGVSPGIINRMQFSEGIYKLKTDNYNLADQPLPDTEVSYKRKKIDLLGTKIEGVFPEFESKFETVLPDNLIIAKDIKQFDHCNKMLKEAVQENPELRKQFSERQLEQIENGNKPSGFIWHHNENRGVMQLVDANTHLENGHTGGKAIWGGGSKER